MAWSSGRATPAESATEPGDLAEAAFEREARRFTLFLAILLAGALLALSLARGFDVGPWSGSTNAHGSHAGEPAPLFDLPSFEGDRVRLADYRGRPVVLNFWASWCAPCRAEAPLLARVADAIEADVAFIGVNVRDRDEDARAFLNDYGINYLNVRDDAGTVESRYAGIGIPTTVFISRDGIIRRTWIGALDEQDLLAFVAEIR